eukprot:TRINITY_DN48360_c0_g1_i1.p1 TRINITY_DN48360_c0_g1~~TRINITY_DN48360_c0_g1_i1.p1  ORF type:complete len:296 (-),score=31.37 TRINITY_DN48360_c0_g1_i1:259-1146(-)
MQLQSVPALAQQWLTLEGYGRLLGSFTQNAICITYPNPLAEYLEILSNNQEVVIDEELQNVFKQWLSVIENNNQLSDSEDSEEEFEDNEFEQGKDENVDNCNYEKQAKESNEFNPSHLEKNVDKQSLKLQSNCGPTLNGKSDDCDNSKVIDVQQQESIIIQKNCCEEVSCQSSLTTDVLNKAENNCDIKLVIQKCKESCEGLVGSGVFQVLSSVNHSCEPNASVGFFDWQKKATLVATRQISQGEEVCISYIDVDQHNSYLDRVNELKEYNFSCDCKRCEEDCLVQTKKRKIEKV